MNILKPEADLTALVRGLAPHFAAVGITAGHLSQVDNDDRILLLLYVEAAGDPDQAVALIRELRARTEYRANFLVEACLAGLRATDAEHTSYDELRDVMRNLSPLEIRDYIPLRLGGVSRAHLKAWRADGVRAVNSALQRASVEEAHQAHIAGIGLSHYAKARRWWSHEQIMSIPACFVSDLADMRPDECTLAEAVELLEAGMSGVAWRTLHNNPTTPAPNLGQLKQALNAGLAELRLQRFAELCSGGQKQMPFADAQRLALTAEDWVLVEVASAQLSGVPGEQLVHLVDTHPRGDKRGLRTALFHLEEQARA